MAFADQLPVWIAQTRVILDPANPPKLNVTEKQFAAPWLSDALIQLYSECDDYEDDLQALTETCEQALLASGEDVSARFVVLHLYYWLKRVGLPHVEPDDVEQLQDEAYQRTVDAFAHLASLLPIEDCPRAWPRVRWEITNAYAAGLRKRATDLYDLAERESLITASDARLMRGSFRYVLAREGMFKDDPLGDVTWEPRVLGSEQGFLPPQRFVDRVSDQLAQATLFAGAISGDTSNPTEVDRIDEYRDARHDLEKALAAGDPGVCGVYQAMLARCYLEVGDNANAARSFQGLLKRTIDFGSELGNSRQFRPAFYLTTARSFRAAEQAADAASTLAAALREYPNDRALLLEQASLAEQETDFVQAFRSLKAATEADPEHEWDLGTRLAVVLGEAFVSTKEAASVIESARKRNPEVADLIEELVGLYWPTFRLLANGTRDQWVDGIDRMILASRPEARLRSTLLQNAVFSFAKAVEGELRERVFKPAKAALEGQAQAARARAGTLDPFQPEHRFVLFVIGKEKKLMLGDMQKVLAASRKSREGLSAELRTWLGTRVSRWEALVGVLDLIVQARNPAVHEYGVESNAPKVHEQCQRALEILVGQAR